MKRREFLISSSSTAVAALAGPFADCHSSLVSWESRRTPTAHSAAGPLRVHPDNPRHFTDGSEVHTLADRGITKLQEAYVLQPSTGVNQ